MTLLKGRYTLGDKLLQHVAATDHSVCTGRATSCSNKVRRHVAATNRFVCTGEFLWKSLSPQQNFVAATSRKKSNQTESVRLVAATNSVAATKIFTKILQYTRSDLSPRHVAATCCLECTDLYCLCRSDQFTRAPVFVNLSWNLQMRGLFAI